MFIKKYFTAQNGLYVYDYCLCPGKDGQLAHGPDSVIAMLDYVLAEYKVPG